MNIAVNMALANEMSGMEREAPIEVVKQSNLTEHIRQLEQAVFQTDASVVITSASGIVQFVNPAFERNSGYSANEALGRRPRMVQSGEHSSAFYSELWETLGNGQPLHATFTNRRKNGEIYHEETTISPIRDSGARITHFVATGHDITSRIHAERRLSLISKHDGMTGLPKRSLLMERMEQIIGRCRQNAQRFSLLLVDLDRFKRINDALGKSVGDKLLVKVAKRLVENVGAQGWVARLGGDEFTIILENLDYTMAVEELANALVFAFSRPFEIDGRFHYIGISIGITTFPDDGDDTESLLRRADIAMYQAKSLGRGTCVHFSPVMEGAIQEDLAIEVSLRSALDNSEFEIHYQPVIRPEDRRIVAVEALLRWHSPQHGTVPPGRFVPMLEESGMIGAVGRWVLETACSQIKAMEHPGEDPLILAVNLSGRQFRDGNLISDIRDILLVSGLAPGQLELEITESILIEDASAAGRTLEALSALGIRLAIDDFGTGYSSLSYLRRFPINTLKIDRSFVIEMEESTDAVAIIKAIIGLADNLGLEIVAEGVETVHQLAQLSGFGCRKVQGFLFSRPLPLAELTRLLKSPVQKFDSFLKENDKASSSKSFLQA